MSLYYSDKIKSTDLNKYGIIDATEISGHKRVNALEELYQIPDTILSQSGNNTDNDALGQVWYVYESDSEYSLVNWELRNESNGWRKKEINLSDYATKEELNEKQDTISDLDTIRSGAALGATSVQESDLATVATSGSYNDLTDKLRIVQEVNNLYLNYPAPTAGNWIGIQAGRLICPDNIEGNIANNNFIIGYNKLTASASPNTYFTLTPNSLNIETNNETILEVTSTGDGSKFLSNAGTYKTVQDTLVSGTNIKTINGESILGEGDITIESGSEQIQADWNETDTTSPAYIANKPNITTYGTEDVTISGNNISLSAGYGVFVPNVFFDTGVWITSLNSNTFEIYNNNEQLIAQFRRDGNGTKFLSDNGTYKEISSAYPLVNHGTSDTTFTLTPNTFHVWDEVTALDLDFGTETEGVANEYLFQFNSGTEATTLTLPDTIKWMNDSIPTIEANKIYQVSVLKGLGSIMTFSNT